MRHFAAHFHFRYELRRKESLALSKPPAILHDTDKLDVWLIEFRPSLLPSITDTAIRVGEQRWITSALSQVKFTEQTSSNTILMAYLSQGPLSLSLRLFGLRLQRRWLKINISSGLTANTIWCVPQRGYGIVDFRMDSRPQENQVYTFVENAGGDDEMVEVGWGVGVGLLVSWTADKWWWLKQVSFFTVWWTLLQNSCCCFFILFKGSKSLKDVFDEIRIPLRW